MRLRILLTGGSGLVGRNFLEHPAIGEFDVLAPVHRELDLLDFKATEAYLRQNRPDFVIHAAGRVGGIQANIREPVSFLLDNLDMGRNVIGAAHASGVKRLLNLGSSCMYPRSANNPLREEQVLKGELEPTNEGYALAKIATTRLCEYIARQDPSCQYKTLIPCNLYGHHDKFDPDSSHLVAAVIQKIHEAVIMKSEWVEVWGDGDARREFLYAGDFADCLFRAVTHFDSLPPVMNVGVGSDHTIMEYYRTAADIIGFSGRFVTNPSKPVGMRQKLLSTEKAEAWGWRSRTSLREGMEITYKFLLDQVKPLI